MNSRNQKQNRRIDAQDATSYGQKAKMKLTKIVQDRHLWIRVYEKYEYDRFVGDVYYHVIFLHVYIHFKYTFYYSYFK